MCGIAGIFHLGTPKPVDPARVVLMTDAMVHRGPDGAGVWTRMQAAHDTWHAERNEDVSAIPTIRAKAA